MSITINGKQYPVQQHPELAFRYPTDETPEQCRAKRLKRNARLAKINAERHAKRPRKTKLQKTRAAAYEMLLVELMPGAIRFMLETYHYGIDDEEFILSEAQSLVEDQANMFVYEWKEYDDYIAKEE